MYLWSLLLLVTPGLALDTVEAETELGWGQQHVRDQAEAALVVVVPGEGEGEAALRLADIPHNTDWGLVELSSETDLQSAEAGQQGESFAPSKMMIRLQQLRLKGVSPPHQAPRRRSRWWTTDSTRARPRPRTGAGPLWGRGAPGRGRGRGSRRRGQQSARGRRRGWTPPPAWRGTRPRPRSRTGDQLLSVLSTTNCPPQHDAVQQPPDQAEAEAAC